MTLDTFGNCLDTFEGDSRSSYELFRNFRAFFVFR